MVSKCEYVARDFRHLYIHQLETLIWAALPHGLKLDQTLWCLRCHHFFLWVSDNKHPE